jgi:hypothetical protein
MLNVLYASPAAVALEQVTMAGLLCTCQHCTPPPPPHPPQAFIDKFRFNAKRASLVQSRIKALERMAEVQVRRPAAGAETAAAASRMSEAVASLAGGRVLDCQRRPCDCGSWQQQQQQVHGQSVAEACVSETGVLAWQHPS